MTQRILFQIFATLFAVLVLPVTMAGAEEFKALKTQQIQLASGRALIVLPNGGEALESLRFRVKGGPLALTSVEIVYADLSDQKIDVARDAIPDGGSYTIQTAVRDQAVRQLMLRFLGAERSIEVTVLGAAPDAPKSPAVAQEKLAWNAIRESNTREAYQKYLEDYPDGQFRLLARRAVAALAGSDAATQSSTRSVARSPSRPRAVERAPRQPESDTGVRGLAQPGGGSASGSGNVAAVAPSEIPCVAAQECTPVSVFFGTNRARQDKDGRVSFGWEDANRLQLGSAVVTVPRHGGRPIGAIARPGWWDLYVSRIPPEGDPKRHFVIAKNGISLFSSETEFLAAVAKHRDTLKRFKDDAFIFVHGYNTDFDESLYRTAQIAFDLGAPELLAAALGAGGGSQEAHLPYGTAFMYTWPSAGTESDYAWDKDYVRLSIDHLERFVKLVVEKSGAKNVHVIAHSMGNIAMLNALSEYVEKAQGANASGATIKQVILAAPDISESEFVRLARKILPASDGITLYASSRDWALELSRQFHRGQPRVGDIVGDKPTVLQGVDTIDISNITSCYFCSGHSEFADQKDLLGDIARLFREGTRPPDRRAPGVLSTVPLEGGINFWRYVPAR